MKYLDLLEKSVANFDIKILHDQYCVYYETIDNIIDNIFVFIDEAKKIKNYTGQYSAHLNLNESVGDFYMRFGRGKSSRFGHDNICFSSVSIAPNKIGKKIFSVILAIILSFSKENSIIVSIENPIEKRFQDYLKKVGFTCINKQMFGLGVYYFMLDEKALISKEEFYGLLN